MLNSHLVVKTRPLANVQNVVIWNDIRVTVLTPDLFRIEKTQKKSFVMRLLKAFGFAIHLP